MPSKPELMAVRAEIERRMRAGELMTWRKCAMLAQAHTPSRSWSHDLLSRWHKRERIHVAYWVRSKVGPPNPVYAWGRGRDAERPSPLSNGEKCARWRTKSPIGLFDRSVLMQERRSP